MDDKIKRTCLTCNQSFRPMTEKQWKIVKYEHETMSNKHMQYLRRKYSL